MSLSRRPWSRTPAGLPVLGAGRHRGPRHGACFMEYASVLAGERWSDAPRTTHPALATLARAVNDCTSDVGRRELLPLVPDVVGTRDATGAVLGHRLARLAVLAALEVATGARRRTLSVALLGAELSCGPGGPGDDPDRAAVRALLRDPDPALAWAARFVRRSPTAPAYDRLGVPQSIELAARTLQQTPDGDERLRALLVSAVALVRGTRVPVPVREPARA